MTRLPPTPKCAGCSRDDLPLTSCTGVLVRTRPRRTTTACTAVICARCTHDQISPSTALHVCVGPTP